MDKKPLICIVGPTASGKSALAVELAKAVNGEIVSADSMQIYKYMDIGTAKPDSSEKQGIVHHMMDFLEPEEVYSVARYVKESTQVIDDIHMRGKMPIVVGGTGLYIDSLLRSMDFAENPSDMGYRQELENIAEADGGGILLNKLREIDPEYAEALHVNDHKRIIRALEVYHTSGVLMSEHIKKTSDYKNRYNSCIIGLTFADRQRLYDRINMRVDNMIKAGVVEELKALLEKGIEKTATAFQAIGYKELMPYIHGDCSLEEATESLKQATRRYAKRQLTWFRRNPDINWLYLDDMKNISEILQCSTRFIDSCGIL